MTDLMNDIGKRLPYNERAEYLSSLVDSAAEKAIVHDAHARRRRRLSMMAASVAAVALLVIGIGVAVNNNIGSSIPVTAQADGPLDEFLNTLTDEEAAQLTYYEIEEIPEY